MTVIMNDTRTYSEIFRSAIRPISSSNILMMALKGRSASSGHFRPKYIVRVSKVRLSTWKLTYEYEYEYKWRVLIAVDRAHTRMEQLAQNCGCFDLCL